MSSIEIIILCVTGAIACITYVVKHAKSSECWTSKSCFSCKMDKSHDTPSVSIELDDEKVEPRIIVSSVV